MKRRAAADPARPRPERAASTAADAGDGRARRRARNHAAIVDATHALILAGDPAPTAEAIAARARVGVRTVFRQFEDLDGLFASVGARVVREVLAAGPPPPPTGDLDRDLRALVERRARGYAKVGPFLRAARQVRRPPESWRAREDDLRRWLRAGLARALAPHLVGGAAVHLHALELLLSFDAWEQLREHQRLASADAIEVLVAACRALLG